MDITAWQSNFREIQMDNAVNQVLDLPFDRTLRERASRVVPGGMWGHMNAQALPHGYPQFFSRARGARVWDADGNEYVDFMCAYGPMILGYSDRDVDAAANAQKQRFDAANGPGLIMVELAELLVDTIPSADWALFSKNGTDATTSCVMIARAATGRKKILLAKGAYHGAVPWCTAWPGGVTPEDRAHLICYTYNDLNSLDEAVDQAGNDLAGIMVSAFRHDARHDQELPTQAFADAVRTHCTRKGAALMLDDVRAGFRLHLGGSWEPLGVRPDLTAYSKALGNGYAVAAVTGADSLRDAAQQVFVTGSFWCNAVAMAAAHATISKLRATDAVANLKAIGERFRRGVGEQAARHNIGIRQTGPAQMPLVLFDDDAEFEKGNLFCVTALRHGVYMHPWHNMFLSAAHGQADIDLALQGTEHAFEVVARAIRGARASASLKRTRPML